MSDVMFDAGEVALSPETLAAMSARDRGIERYPITDRKSWLQRRQQDVTASIAGALFGVHDYATYYGLWALKSGLVADSEETSAMRRGRLLEPVALQMLREERPTWRVDRGTTYYRDPLKRVGATPDAFCLDLERAGFGIAQFKSVEASIFRRKWVTEDGVVEPPLWIAIQAIIEAALTGASWAVVAPLVVGFGVELPVIDIPLHGPLYQKFVAKAQEFWVRVESGTAPDPDYGRDADIISQLYPRSDGSVLDLSNDNRIRAIAEEDAELAAIAKEALDRRKALKAEVLAKIGLAEVVKVNDAVLLTAKTIRQKAYQVKENSYRSIRWNRSA